MKRLAKIIQAITFASSLMSLNLFAGNAGLFGNLPLWFQGNSSTNFTAHGIHSEFIISPTQTAFALSRSAKDAMSGRMVFVGANPAASMSGKSKLAGHVNYLLSNSPGQWRTGLPTYAKVRVTGLYPGVNLVYYGNQRKLEYDFNLAAGVNPSVIALRFSNNKKISLNSHGELIIPFKDGQVVQHPPLAYQNIGGKRRLIKASYKLLDAHTVAFAVGKYDQQQPLVIDPVLTYATYFGGNLGDVANAIAVDPVDGSIYVAGNTFSSTFSNNVPFSTTGAFQTNYHGGNFTGDAFVARFDRTGTNLIYATYLGGSGDDVANGVAVDAQGHAFITGMTGSPDFPTTNSVVYGGYHGSHITGSYSSNYKHYPYDAFVSELDTNGARLIYSTYLGGSDAETAFGLTLDPADNAYITGLTRSPDFPVTTNAFQPHLNCPELHNTGNAFIAEISAGGTNLNYSSFLGGTNLDAGFSIAYNNHRVFVAGVCYSTNFPTTNSLDGFGYLDGVTNNSINLPSDGFVTAFAVSSTNLSLLYSTFLGGSGYDAANGIAAGPDGNAYVAGYTTSTNFPYTTTNVANLPTAYVVTNNNNYIYGLTVTNGFLTQIKWNGSKPSIGYSAIFGGQGLDEALGVALDPQGNAYVVGSATSTNFPATTNISGYLSATNNSQLNAGYSDAFVMAFNTNASALLYSTYLGGYNQDYGYAIAVDPLGNAYVAGQTYSANFPTVNAFQSQMNGTSDMFLAKISQTLVPPAPLLSLSPHSAGGTNNLNLRWQMFPDNYEVQTSTDLGSTNWSIWPQSPMYSNGWYQLTVPATNSLEFFRLHQH